MCCFHFVALRLSDCGYYMLSHRPYTTPQQTLPSHLVAILDRNQTPAMNDKRIILTNILLVLTALTSSSYAFIDSPLDWAFAPNPTRGLVCPSLR